MKSKKWMALMCAASLTAGTLAGCGAKATEETKAPAATQSAEKETTAAATAAAQPSEAESAAAEPAKEAGPAITGNGETLVIGIQSQALIEDYEDNYFTKMLEEALNINLEMVLLPSGAGDFRTKVSMMLASGEDIPDVFIGSAFENATVRAYGEQGLLLPLNEYMEDPDMNPNWLTVPEDVRKEIIDQCATPDGTMYGFGKLNSSTWNNHPYRTFINRAWLDKLGLEMPTTTDELYNVLKAFANEDPNGNGKKDEIATYGITSMEGRNIIWNLMNSFIFYNGGSQNYGLALSEDGSTVIAPYTADEFRDGLEYCRKLCEEGIIPEAVFTDDKTQFEANLNAETPVVGMVGSLSTSHWANADTNPNFMELEAMVPVAGPEGIAYTPTKKAAATMQYVIAADCEHPELAYALGEYIYNRDVTLTGRYGVKGIDWTNAPEIVAPIAKERPEVKAGVIAEDNAVLFRYRTDINIWTTANKTTWKNVQHGYAGDLIEIDAKSAFDSEQPTNKAKEVFYYNYIGRYPEHILPFLVYGADESEAVVEYGTAVKKYVDSSAAEFITGQRPLDDQSWNEYLQNLEAIGLQQLLEAAQAAYERTIK